MSRDLPKAEALLEAQAGRFSPAWAAALDAVALDVRRWAEEEGVDVASDEFGASWLLACAALWRILPQVFPGIPDSAAETLHHLLLEVGLWTKRSALQVRADVGRGHTGKRAVVLSSEGVDIVEEG